MTAAAQCFVFLPFFFFILTPRYLGTLLKNALLPRDLPVSNLKPGVSTLLTQFMEWRFLSWIQNLVFFLTQKVDVLSTWKYSVFRTFGLLAAVDGRFHLHDRITEFLQRQDFQFSALIVYHCQMTWDIAWCFFYRPCGFYSHSSFHYFSSPLLLIHTQTRQSARSIFGWFFSLFFFVCRKGSSPRPPQLDQNESAKQISEAPACK